MALRHFLELEHFPPEALTRLLELGLERKRDPGPKPCIGRTLALFFREPSTRTRLSFAAAIGRLGGQAVVLLAEDLHLDRGETVADTARAVSCYADAVLLRSTEQDFFDRFTAEARIPVINGLTARSHPAQVLADMLTLTERLPVPLAEARVAWSGAFNNMTRSYLQAAARLGFELRLAVPEAAAGLGPGAGGRALARAREEGGRISLHEAPEEAVAGAHAVVTDAWSSLGDDPAPEAVAARAAALERLRVDGALFARAREDAVFLHCLPAHRGEEVTAEVIDGPRSLVWEEAANRLPAQEAILLWALGAEDLPGGVPSQEGAA